jgi:hypothetical protein
VERRRAERRKIEVGLMPILAVLRETQRFMQTGAFDAQTPAAITQSRTDNCLFGWKIAKPGKTQ